MKAVAAHNRLYSILTVIFGAFTVWWFYIQITQPAGGTQGGDFSDTYFVIPLLAACIGVVTTRRWGGFSSVFGRAIWFFALGLFAQVFGQVAYTYYARVLNTPIPYPSVGDIGYFGSIPLYIYALLQLGKASGMRMARQPLVIKIIAIAIPVVLLGGSYAVFLRGYQADWHQPIGVILDFGYPLGQAIYVSLAVLIFILSRKVLGGRMRPSVLLFLAALVVQYSADYLFLYQNNHNTWVPGGIDDYLYVLAYVIMAVALLRFKAVANAIRGQ